jgi:hypothetical protein
MKLQRIVSALILLGLSAPVLAGGFYRIDASSLRDVMRDRVNREDIILDQNQPGGFDQPCGWTCRINVSGWINADAYLANRPPVFLNFNPIFDPTAPAVAPDNFLFIPTAGRASDLLLNNANLFFDVRVNNWVTANASLVYSSLSAIPGSQGFYGVADSLFVYHPIPSGTVVTRSIDTAYATIGNFQVSPIYLRVGKEYLPFGQYDPYAFVQSENPTQLFTEINAPTAQLGFIIPNGLYGSVYAFAGNPKLNDGGSTRRIQNGGVDLGYGWKMWNSKINVDAGWLANIADSNFLSSYYLNSLGEGTAVPGLPNSKTPAWDVNADITFGPFDANGHYISTTRDLANPIFLSGSSGPAQPVIGAPASLGKPTVWGLEAGLTFPVMAHQSRFALGWQQTTHLASFLPKKRIYADYMVNIAKWFDLGLAVFQDKDYSPNESGILGGEGDEFIVVNPGATGNKSTVGQLRASIKFA